MNVRLIIFYVLTVWLLFEPIRDSSFPSFCSNSVMRDVNWIRWLGLKLTLNCIEFLSIISIFLDSLPVRVFSPTSFPNLSIWCNTSLQVEIYVNEIVPITKIGSTCPMLTWIAGFFAARNFSQNPDRFYPLIAIRPTALINLWTILRRCPIHSELSPNRRSFFSEYERRTLFRILHPRRRELTAYRIVWHFIYQGIYFELQSVVLL